MDILDIGRTPKRDKAATLMPFKWLILDATLPPIMYDLLSRFGRESFVCTLIFQFHCTIRTISPVRLGGRSIPRNFPLGIRTPRIQTFIQRRWFIRHIRHPSMPSQTHNQSSPSGNVPSGFNLSTIILVRFSIFDPPFTKR